ncbi:MAG: transglycosylase SLT domain-containing protein, partial [Bdellovibrionia bacterium]
DLSQVTLLARSQEVSPQFLNRLRLINNEIDVKVSDTQSLGQLMKIANRSHDNCVIGEKILGTYQLRFFPRLSFVTDLTAPFALRWWIRSDNNDLYQLLHFWFQQAARDNEILPIHERYQAYIAGLNRADIQRLRLMIDEILPLYLEHFRASSQSHGLPWQLVAAVSYQESHWNPEARSFTGVKGIMQLTQQTALHLGVADREDPEESIWGGAKYIRMLLDRTPKDLNASDRLALTLATYNIGVAHLLDAQALARQKKLNPYAWHDLKKILPLLEDPKVAANLKYGRARGTETVAFVERVKAFYNVLISANL